MIGALDHFHVVLDDDDRVTLIDQFIKRPKQPLDIVEMQTRGRLIENKQRAGLLGPGHMRSQFEALRLASGKSREGLAEPNVFKADGAQWIQPFFYFRQGP